MFGLRKTQMVSPEEALQGRTQALPAPGRHAVLGTPMQPPYPAGLEVIDVGMGCFWGAERAFWTLDGVYTTAVGYAGGYTPNPLYEEVCTGMTGHAEVVRIVYDPEVLPTQALLQVFWESHDPTQGMRQGNDTGTQYRSAIYTHSPAQASLAAASARAYQEALAAAGRPAISTEIAAAGAFYFAEPHHQQYLHKNPDGYCGLGGTGVCFPA
ncbi:peptide-methionine (S)-S-oxide reductase MsrA [Granulosicoccaceae sp. 1_MG-2023]|nr:peptide-methionine (S)-S-oxide reductase MsrA [Granulosicoccaceae sp. 1_MG-2023]